MLIGASRKAFIGKLDGSRRMPTAIGGTIAACLAAAAGGAAMVRVHDVASRWSRRSVVARPIADGLRSA